MNYSLFKIVFLLLINLFLAGEAKAVENSIVINELAWMGTGISANDEWIELYNGSDGNIDLSGWRLMALDGSPEISLSGVIEADGYFLLERTDDSSASGTAGLVYSGALANSGENLALLDNEGNEAEILEFSAGWPAGDNSSKQTMCRTASGGWQNSREAGGSPGAKNDLADIAAPDEEDESEGAGAMPDNNEAKNDPESGYPDSLRRQSVKYGSIVINEAVMDPEDGEEEWIELYNKEDEDISLEGWYLEEGSGAKTKLSGRIGSGKESRFLVVEKPKGNLNNKGDVANLRDFDGKLIDKLIYGDWDKEGSPQEKAPAAKDPFSLARLADGRNSYNNAADFALTEEKTRGGPNIIRISEASEESSAGPGTDAFGDHSFSKEVVISEIMPNPLGSDEEEFIELFNAGGDSIGLHGWRVGDKAKEYEIKGDARLEAGGFFLLARNETRLALNNGGDAVKLYPPGNKDPLQELEYEKAREGMSYSLIFKKDGGFSAEKPEYNWTKIPTPGKTNQVEKINHPPLADFFCPKAASSSRPVIFDASDTVDEDGDELSFFWDFGDGFTSVLKRAEHTFFTEGAYAVSLTASDKEQESVCEKTIVIGSSAKAASRALAAPAGKSIVINELLPDPAGSDSGEWIELKNESAAKADISGWRLDDEDGGSRPHTIEDGAFIGPRGYFLFERAKTKIALNNEGDAVRLLDAKNGLVDEVFYKKSFPGRSYARGRNDKWFWTGELTPGEENVIKVSDDFEAMAGSQNTIAGKETASNKQAEDILADLFEIKDIEAGETVTTSGTAAVLPGVLGSQIFYIVSSNALGEHAGAQIYSYKKDFGEFAVGDLLKIRGELSLARGERRLKTKTKADIVFIKSGEEPGPRTMMIENIGESHLGQLIKVSGEVVEQKGSTAYIDDDSDELRIYVKAATGLSAKSLKEGARAAVTGILGRTSSGLRLMPRFEDDIVLKDVESEEAGKVLGEVAAADEWEIAKRDRKLELFRYLLAAAGSIIFLLSGVILKLKS